MLPGIRRVINFHGTQGGSGIDFEATGLIPARSLLRSILYAVDGTLAIARRATLRLAFGNTAIPVADDFVGTGILIGNDNPLAPADGMPSSPAGSILPFTVNFLLPDSQGRILIRMTNGNAVEIEYHLRLVVDSISQLGGRNGRG